MDDGADFILVETVFDTLNCKAAIMAVRQLERELGREVPMMISLTLTDLSGRNLSGHTVEAFWHAVRHANPVAIGLNCSFGAEQLRPHIQLLSGIADTLLLAYPNAGLPNELGEYDEAPEATARAGWGLGGERAGEHPRRLLRFNAGTHRGDCCGGEGAQTTQSDAAAIGDAASGTRAVYGGGVKPLPFALSLSKGCSSLSVLRTRKIGASTSSARTGFES